MNYIYHIDMDAFFTSIEILKNKNLINKPIVVGSKNNGVVSSANYIARKFGIKAAMPIFIAKNLCKDLIIVENDAESMNLYSHYSSLIFNLLKEKITNKIEIGSIDEWYIDVSDTKFSKYSEIEIANLIKSEINNNFSLECSIGCSYNKFLAKMATNLCKPNGFLIIDRNNFKEKIWNLPIRNMLFIGKKNEQILKENGIQKIEDISKYKNDYKMLKLIGNMWIKYKENSNGNDSDPINLKNKTKSIGKSVSFYNEKNLEEIYKIILKIKNEINFSVDKGKIYFKNLNISVKLKNSKTSSKNKSFIDYQNIINILDVKNLLYKLLQKVNIWEIKNISLSISNIVQDFLIIDQISINDIFTDKKLEKENNHNNALLSKLNRKFSKKIFYLASEKIK